MCRRYRGTLSCAVRASGGGGHSHLSCVRVVTVPSLGGGLEAKNILFFRPDSVRSPISISNLQSRCGGPGEGRGGSNLQGDALWIHSQCKRISTLFSRHFAISSRPTRSLGAFGAKSESPPLSQDLKRLHAPNARSQTPLEHLHRRRFASTSSSIYCSSWQEICHLRDL